MAQLGDHKPLIALTWLKKIRIRDVIARFLTSIETIEPLFSPFFLNTLAHCMAVLFRIVDGVRCKELKRQTGRRSSAKEQSHPPVGTREEVKKVGSLIIDHFVT